MLGLRSYETAWAWLHKLRRAMVRPDRELLADVVELDESFVGGRSTGRLGGSTDKAPVMIAVERWCTSESELRLGRVRLGVADSRGGRQLVDFACEPVNRARPSTPTAPGCSAAGRRGLQTRVHPGSAHPNPATLTLPGPHRVASLLKRWTAGTLHYRVGPPAPAVLPRRVHLPVQSAPTSGAGHALLPVPPASRRHGPASAQRTRQSHVKGALTLNEE